MNILHTSDWHIGQKLYNNERYEEHQQFLDWLLTVIEERQIDLLLVSGDVFDTTNPSHRALELYYQFLAKCFTRCSNIIITGGNHDSVTMLNAARHPLNALNVHVVGGVPEKIEDEIIPIKNKEGKVLFTVCAVPFLRDKDLKSSVIGETHEERIIAIKSGIVKHYEALAELAEAYKTPSIAMGHLFALGSKTSDSERDIHIGNLGEVSSNQFPVFFDYIALGHIHKPQKLGGNDQIRYSGSPIPLSFSERKDTKEVVLLNFDGKAITYQESIEVPVPRKLILIKGTFEEVTTKLNAVDSSEELSTWIEVQIIEEKYSPTIISDFEAFKEEYKQALILKYKVQFTEQVSGADELYDEGIGIEDLKPKEVFERKIEDLEDKDTLLETFDELMNLMEEEG